ncbi:MAG: OsmC family protein [Actinobacteria bacterium]|nr:OsmC family protein [Actinomycetota bacterium]
MKHVSEAVGSGGRLGRVRSTSGSYDHEVRIPGVKADGVTPEEMIAGAWVACFGMTFIDAARAADTDATEVEYSAQVTIEAANGIYTITEATLTIDAPELDPGLVDELAVRTHQVCPVSKVLTEGVAKVEIVNAAAKSA